MLVYKAELECLQAACLPGCQPSSKAAGDGQHSHETPNEANIGDGNLRKSSARRQQSM